MKFKKKINKWKKSFFLLIFGLFNSIVLICFVFHCATGLRRTKNKIVLLETKLQCIDIWKHDKKHRTILKRFFSVHYFVLNGRNSTEFMYRENIVLNRGIRQKGKWNFQTIWRGNKKKRFIRKIDQHRYSLFMVFQFVA